MKKRLLLLLLISISCFTLLIACQNPTTPESFVGSGDAVEIKADALTSYNVTFPIRLDGEKTAIMESFVKAFAEKSGVRLTMGHDMKEAKATEILFAETSRDAYASLSDIFFRTDDFLLAICADKPVILAGSTRAYKKATDFLLSACVGEDGSLWFPKHYLSSGNYTIESFKIGENLCTPDTYTIADYVSATGAANYLSDVLDKHYGYAFELSRSSLYKHIVIGQRLDTDNRATYLCEVDGDGNLYISALDESKTVNAVKLFLYNTFGMIDTLSGATVKDGVFAPENDVLELQEQDYNTLQSLAFAQRNKATLYVTANATGGGDGSEAAPYTLSEAFLRAAELANGDNVNITINLAEGTYILSETATLAAESMSKQNYSITIKGAGADKTVITSALPIEKDELVPVDGTLYFSYQLPDSLRDETGAFPPIRDLLVNGEMMEPARTEGEAIMNFDAQKYQKKYDIDKGYFVDTTTPVLSEDQVLYISEDLVQQIDVERVAGTEIWIKVEWQIHGLYIESINMNKTKVDGGKTYYGAKIRDEDWIRLLGKAGSGRNYYSTLDGRGFWLQNNIGLLSENSFVYRRETGTFYIMPQSDSDSFAVPLLDQLFCFKNLSNVTVDGIGFTGTTDTYISENGYITGQTGYQKDGGVNGFLPFAAVYGENLDNIHINACSFYELGCDGVSVRGVLRGVRIEHNEFIRIGGSAIRVGNCVNYDAKNRSEDIQIRHNYIDHTGVVFTSNVAIAVYPVNGLRLMHNTVKNSNYSAISVGWSWGKATVSTPLNVRNAEIACNYIEGFMLGMKDGGAIYVLGGNDVESNTTLLNQIYENYCVVSPETGMLAGKKTGTWTVLYHDSGSSHWHTHHNVIYSRHDETPSSHGYISYQMNQTYNNHCEFNFLIGAEQYWVFGAGGNTDNGQPDKNGQIFNNNYAYPDTESAKADPEIVAIVEQSGCDGAHGVFPAD